MAVLVRWPDRHPRIVAMIYVIIIPTAIVAIAIGGLVRTSHLAVQGKEAHDALCTFKADLVERVHAGRQFLREHPEGFAGIDAPTIRNSLDNQQRTIDALRIKCK